MYISRNSLSITKATLHLLLLSISVLISLPSYAQTTLDPCPDMPDVIDNFDPSKSNYHIYTEEDFEICDLKNYPQGNKLMIFQILLDHASFAAPGAPDEPIVNCRPLTLPGFGTIVQKIRPAEFSVTNYTTSDHYFRDGKVTRHIIQVGSKILIRTTGVGNNISWARKQMNQNSVARWLVWPRVNERLKETVLAKLNDLAIRKPLSYSLLYQNYYAVGKYNYTLLGKFSPNLSVFIADHPANSWYAVTTGRSFKAQFECDANLASDVITAISGVPRTATTDDRAFESMTAIFNAKGMRYEPVAVVDAGPAKLIQLVNESGVLNQLVASGKTSAQDYSNMFKADPEIGMLSIPCLEAYIVRYYADFGFDKWIGAQVIIINGKAFPLSGRRAKPQGMYFYRLGDEYYLRIGFLRGGSGQEQIWKITPDGLVQVYASVPAC